VFKVANADFIADKLASELLPNQEFREVLKNALEAVERRQASTPGREGRIEFDVDWSLLSQTGRWYISCADDGDGMSRAELDRYMTTLAVEGAGRNQSIHGNQGMGLKISGPTRHRKGILIRSMKAGERTMVQVGWNGSEYDLIPLGPDGQVVSSTSAGNFPRFVSDGASGTVVTFLGNADDDNTFLPSDHPRSWLFKYLNMRFFRLSHDGVKVFVRVPSGDIVDWPRTAEEASERMRGEGRSFNLTAVKGTATVWDDAADRVGGGGARGTVELPGNRTAGLPPARLHWWVLPTGPGVDVSSRTASGGSSAVMFQNELHDWRLGNQANPYFARLGVIFAKNRIAFVLEPLGATITSDFARAHVLVGGRPVFESEAWFVWADQFRQAMPEQIRQAMDEEQGRLQHEDPDRLRRIRDRLRDVMHLLRPRRFRSTPNGASRAAGPTVAGSGSGTGAVAERVVGAGKRGSTKRGARGIGAVLSEVAEEDGEPSTEIHSVLALEPRWVTEAESEGLTIVRGNGNGLHDRAAALAGEDGRTAGILLLNREFRGYRAILAAVNEWANPEGDEDKSAKIMQLAQEWVEQKMIEAVYGLRQLENGSTWITQHYDEALSPVGLTAAFMADRYHTLIEVKRVARSVR